MVSDVCTLADAGLGDVSFLENPRYVGEMQKTSAAACFMRETFADKLHARTIGLFTDRPYHALARALLLFYPDSGRPLVYRGEGGPVHPDAKIEEGAVVEPGAVVGPEAQIGAGTLIAAGAVVGYGVTIGRDGYVGPNASVTHALVGDRVVIHACASIGTDGFGFAMGPDGHLKIPQIGRVIIQDDVEIGAGSTIDRGALSDTVIGEGTVGISGSTVLEDFVVMGGQTGVTGHVRIGAGAQIAATSGVSHSIPAGERWGGTPAKPMAQWSREIAVAKALGETLNGKVLARLKQFLN